MRVRALLVVCVALAVLVPPAASGGGGAPSIAFSPSSWDFGTINSGSTSSKTFTLRNSGGSATGALTAALSGSSAFSRTADTCTATSLGPKKTCSVTIRYAPSADGSTDTGTLRVSSKKPVAVATAALIGHTHSQDVTSPDVTIDQASTQVDPTSASTIHFTVVFNESVADFATGDVTLGGTAGATTATVTETAPNNGTTYDVTVSGMTQSGTVTASVTAGVAHDASNNPNNASTTNDNTVTWQQPT